MSNVLITGCNGYLGVEMSMYFRMHGWSVFCVDPKPAQKYQEDVLTDFENKHIQELMEPPWIWRMRLFIWVRRLRLVTIIRIRTTRNTM